jgi:hypothetical protein
MSNDVARAMVRRGDYLGRSKKFAVTPGLFASVVILKR